MSSPEQDDLVERLRQVAGGDVRVGPLPAHTLDTAAEAADKIEALQAKVERLRESERVWQGMAHEDAACEIRLSDALAANEALQADQSSSCPACEGTGKGQGDNDYCGFCGGDGSVPLQAYIGFLKQRITQSGKRVDESDARLFRERAATKILHDLLRWVAHEAGQYCDGAEDSHYLAKFLCEVETKALAALPPAQQPEESTDAS